jgi:DNA-binding XRE family transcriptional regulator
MTTSEKITEKMKELKITQQELADNIGVSRATINRALQKNKFSKMMRIAIEVELKM